MEVFSDCAYISWSERTIGWFIKPHCDTASVDPYKALVWECQWYMYIKTQTKCTTTTPPIAHEKHVMLINNAEVQRLEGRCWVFFPNFNINSATSLFGLARPMTPQLRMRSWNCRRLDRIRRSRVPPCAQQKAVRWGKAGLWGQGCSDADHQDRSWK